MNSLTIETAENGGFIITHEGLRYIASTAWLIPSLIEKLLIPGKVSEVTGEQSI